MSLIDARYECPKCLGVMMDGMPLRYRKSSFACKCVDEQVERDLRFTVELQNKRAA